VRGERRREDDQLQVTSRRALAVLALVAGLVALAVPPSPFAEPATWEDLLAPYGSGVPFLGDFRVREIRRGPDNGIVIEVRGADDSPAVEVLVVERGRWESGRRSQSFTIDYELPRSPAPERDAIAGFLAAVIRERDHGLPAPDAVPLVAGDASVLPRWLESLRGVRGLLCGVSAVVLTLLLLLRAPGLADAGIALGAADLTARFVYVPPLRPDVGAAVIVPAAAWLLFAALRGRWLRARADVRPVLAVVATAACARLALGPWSPLHVNGHGARFVAGAVDAASDIAAYGPGYREIFAPIAALASSSPDWAIFASNALFSALLAPLAFAIGRLTGLTAGAAGAAALLLAIDPVAIRAGATEAYFAPITVLCVLASAMMLVAGRAAEEEERGRAAAALVAAGLLLSQAVRVHPCAWVLAATTPFVLLAAAVGSWRSRAAMAIAAAVIAGGVILATSANVLLDVLGNVRTGAILRPATPSPWSLVWVVLAAAAYGVLAPRRRLAVPAGIAVAALLLTRHAFDASWIWEHAYFRLYLTLPVIAALACVPPRWLHRRWLVVSLAATLAAAWVDRGWPIVTGRSPEQLEYGWVRAQLRRLPPECRVIHLAAAGKRFLALPTYVRPPGTAVAMDRRQPWTIEAATAPAVCLYYVRSSLCSTSEGRPECDAIESRLTLVPVARASFVGARGEETFAHDSDFVETAVARVDRIAPLSPPDP
jgi:hypothetical protein